MRREDQERALVEVVSRVVDGCVQSATGREGHLEGVLSDTLYHEGLRLEREDPSDPATKAYRKLYGQVRRDLANASPSRQKAMLTEITRTFAEEVVGNFDERVYRVATRAVPHGLSALLKGASVRRVASMDILLRRGLQEYVQVEGEVEHVRSLLDKGTLLVAPTHSSNLDSPVLGYAVYLMGIPPLTYGAGLNLFTNPVLSFFMGNLGAYKVDRRKKSALYKAVLKEYSTCALELGYHSLFFPGGTRSRSGEVERNLKKGLLGTAVRAYTNSLMAGRAKPNIYVVPCTINYKLVLEAETLIEDHLKEVGKARFIITDDEFSKPRRILNFMSNLFSLDARISVRFGKPLDVFGNPVDGQGRSLDPRGRVVDPRGYVSWDGVPVRDDQRDRQYTSELASEIAASYGRDNVVMSTSLVAFALNQLLDRANPGMDRYRLLRTGGAQDSFPMAQVHAEVLRVLEAVRSLPDGPVLEPVVRSGDVPDIINDALKHFAIYHTADAAERRGDRVFHHDRNLLLFYGNRLRGYDLGRALASDQEA
jgi:glycerol-3-phosphate O-acyltransferase